MLNEQEWEITPETQARADEATSYMIPLKPGPVGQEPPANRGDDHPWLHTQVEAFEVTNVDVTEIEDKQGRAVLDARVRYTMVDPQSPGFKKAFTAFYKFPKDQTSWNAFQATDKSRLDKLTKTAGLERSTNIVRQVQALKGVRAFGTLVQGYREEMEKNPETGKWDISKGTFRQVQEFRSFKPIA